jgi:hypothetical protein
LSVAAVALLAVLALVGFDGPTPPPVVNPLSDRINFPDLTPQWPDLSLPRPDLTPDP